LLKDEKDEKREHKKMERRSEEDGVFQVSK